MPQRAPVLGPLLLAVVAVLSCLAYATGSVTITKSEFKWPADRVGEPAPLVLAAQSPDSLNAAGPCSSAQSASVVELVTTGVPQGPALTVRAQRGQVWMTYLGQQAGEILEVDGDCTISVNYSRADNTAVLAVGARSTQAVLKPIVIGYEEPPYRQFAVTRLGAARGFVAEITTQPTTFSSSSWRTVWLLFCTGSLIGIGVILRRRYPPPAGQSAGGRRWTAPDTVVAVTAAIAMIVVPPRFDDGWVLTTVRQYADLGFFSNYYSIDAVAQPQGFWWTWLERFWLTPMWTPGFLLRLPTVLILVGTWWLLRRQVLDRLKLDPWAHWAGAVLACAGLVGLQVTIRPEPMIAFLVAAAISVVARYSVSQEAWLLVVLAAVSALALSAHQTGWCVVAASLVTLPNALRWARATGTWIALAAIVVAGAASAATLTMLGTNTTLWWRSVSAFRQDSTTYRSFLNEGERVAGLATRFDQPAITEVAVGLMAVAIVLVLLRSSHLDKTQRAVAWASSASIGGLVLTSSKLVDHYGAVVPAAAVLVALGVNALARAALPAILALVALLAAVSFSGVGVWALGLERSSLLHIGPWALVAFILLVCTLSVVLWMSAHDGVEPVVASTVSVAAIAMIAGVLSVGPLIAEGLRSQESWVGQQIAVARGDTCGFIDMVDLRDPPESVFSQTLTNPGGGVADTGQIEQPSFWARGSLFSPISVDVVTPEGHAASVDLKPSSDVWSSLPVAPQITRAGVRWTDPAVVIAHGTNVTRTSAREQVADSPSSWFVEPGLGLQAPCVRSASIRSGILEGVRNSVGTPGWVAGGLVDSSALTFEAGCANDSATVRNQCVVSYRPSAVPSLAPSVSTEVVS